MITLADALAAFVLKAIVCAVIPNLIFIALFFKTENFAYFLGLAKNIFGNILSRLSGKH